MDEKLESMLEANKISIVILENCKKLILTSSVAIASSEVAKYCQFALHREGLESSFKGVNDYPDILCVSLNDEVIHGLPSEDKMIQKGDVVSLDFGVKVNGYCADTAISFVNDDTKLASLNKKHKLVKTTKQALDEAIIALIKAFPNCYISTITRAIDKYKKKYGIVTNYGGHGVGKTLHIKDIFIPNSAKNFQKDRKLEIDEYFTIEPMFTLGSGETILKDDGFTVCTEDGSLAAHFEYSIAITKDGIIVLK